MTREDIIRMAREAGWNGIYAKPMASILMQEDDFLRFAILAYTAGAAAEKERILEICKEGLWDAGGIRAHLEEKK